MFLTFLIGPAADPLVGDDDAVLQEEGGGCVGGGVGVGHKLFETRSLIAALGRDPKCHDV